MKIGLLLFALFSSTFSAGIAWLLQMMHYPLFAEIGGREFHDYHRRHARLSHWVVQGPQLLALVAAGLLIGWKPWGITDTFLYLNLSLILLGYLSRFFLIRPMHRHLSQHGYANWTIKRLALLQWLPTLLWTASAGILAYGVFEVLIHYAP
jgi:hypothetical protein